MHSVLRLSSRVQTHCVRFTPNRTLPILNRFYAHQSYGGDDSGHQKTDKPNASESVEHPGPPPPSGGSSKDSSGSGDKRTGPKNPEQKQATTSESGSKKAGGARPTLYDPPDPHEEQNEEVKAHNKEFDNRPDRASNRLNNEGKVEKEFWSGGQ